MGIKFRKIRNINVHYHIDLSINGVNVAVDSGTANSISYALATHNKMVDRIEYLESVAEQFMEQGKADTSVTKVSFYSGGSYGGSGFNVVAGHGRVPERFMAISEHGVKIQAVKTLEMRGGGHGEGDSYPVESYKVRTIDSKEWDFNGKTFTITEVISD